MATEHGAINLGQGMPDFPCPPELKIAACQSILDDHNQYPITWGEEELRKAVAEFVTAVYSWPIDSEREVTVTCGATEAMMSSLLALVDPSDEVVIFEPHYENYDVDALLAGANPRFVALRGPDWSIDEDELRAAFGPRTRAVIINSPHNPTGKVFTLVELTLIAELCKKWNAVAITDEIYEHIVFAGRHIPMATLPGMRSRTVTINSLSKTYGVTGWRVGWVIAPPDLTDAIRKVHDFMTVGAPTPLQLAGATALKLPADYYAGLRDAYRARRDFFVGALENVGLSCTMPAGAYYVMADIRGVTSEDDVNFCRRLISECGVAAVPGSAFYSSARDGRWLIRFAFAKSLVTLEQAAVRLSTSMPIKA